VSSLPAATAAQSACTASDVHIPQTYYVKEAFSDTPKKLLEDTVNCMFAHSKKEFRHEAPQDLVYCVGFDVTDRAGGHTLAASRIFSSTDYFEKETKVENLGIEGRGARGVIALAIVSKFAVAALKDTTPGGNGDMKLYVSTDAKEWKRAHFPHGSSARLRENAYTVVESTTHSLGVDVILDDHRSIGTFFVSSSQGTEFVQSLKDTNRNEAGYVDFETLYGVEGAGIANVVHNAQEVESRRAAKQLSSRITLDDGRSWAYLKAPAKDADGKAVGCDVDGDETKCSLHLHSVTVPHNYGRIFSSPAPGFVMGVGSIGAYLKPYTECDTFLSTDAGLTWKMVHKDAHIYEFGDQGGILIMANDEEGTDHIMYSLDLGKTWYVDSDVLLVPCNLTHITLIGKRKISASTSAPELSPPSRTRRARSSSCSGNSPERTPRPRAHTPPST
jgi:hypothetical protein